MTMPSKDDGCAKRQGDVIAGCFRHFVQVSSRAMKLCEYLALASYRYNISTQH